MLITKANSQVSLRSHNGMPLNTKKVTLGDTAPPMSDLSFKKAVTGASYATGGALGGLALGAVSGEVMSHLTGNDVFSTFGGGVGAIGGAVTSLALSLSDEPVSITRTFGSWGGASVGATGGMYLMKGLGNVLASHGASAYFGTYGALIGAVGLGLAGTGIAFAGDHGKAATITKSVAKSATGALVGLTAGGIVQSLTSQLPQLAGLTATIPLVGALSLGVLGLQNEVNKGWTDSDRAPASKTLNVVAQSTMAGGFGYGMGAMIGGVANNFGGSSAYLALAPALGAAVGAGIAYGESMNSAAVTRSAQVALGSGVAAMVGNAVGYGLSALTGQPVFSLAGAVLGATNGAAAVLKAQEKGGRYFMPVASGLSAGTVTGTLLGAGLTALTGHSAYQLAGTAIGVAAGLCAGLAAGADMTNKTFGKLLGA